MQEAPDKRRTRTRSVAIFALKCLIAFGAILWLVRSGKVDFSLLGRSFSYGAQWAACIALLFVDMMIAALRLKCLLGIKAQNRLPYRKLFYFTWISSFMGSALPGGDATAAAVKLFYVRNLDRSLGAPFIIVSLLADKLCGFLALVSLSGLASILFYRRLTAISQTVSPLLKLVIIIFASVYALLLVGLAATAIRRALTRRGSEPRHARTETGRTFFRLAALARKGGRTIPFVVLLSMISQTAQIAAFWLVASPFIEGDIPIYLSLSIMPIGLFAVSIPITPWGIGTGHVAFQYLFSSLNVPNGASLANLWIIALALVSLTGLVPYLLVRMRVKADGKGLPAEADSRPGKS